MTEEQLLKKMQAGVPVRFLPKELLFNTITGPDKVLLLYVGKSYIDSSRAWGTQVYNALRALEKKKLITRVETEDGIIRFELLT